MDNMTVENAERFFVDKSQIQQVVAQINQQMGFVFDPTITPEDAQQAVEESLRENGLRPEDNIFFCGIIAAREE